jgi:hypothetical protein
LVTLQEPTGPAGLIMIGQAGLPVMIEYLLLPEPTIPDVVMPPGPSTARLEVEGRPFKTGKSLQFRVPVKGARRSPSGILISITGDDGEWLPHGDSLGFSSAKG